MSNAVNGVIQSIVFKPKPGGADQWGKTHFASLNVGGQTYDCGGVKPSPRGQLQLRVQNGKDWVTLADGDQVQFFAKPNGNYNRVEGKIMLVAMGNGNREGQDANSAPAAVATAQQQATASTQPAQRAATQGGDAMQTRIENGQAFNIACELAIARQLDFTAANILPLVAGVHKIRDKIAAAGWGREGNAVAPAQAAPTAAPVVAQPAPVTPPPAAVTAPVAQATVKPEFDEDDIPF